MSPKIYDIVIVGSGMGALVASVVLSMEGFSVLVLEKNHQIGGSLQVFSRDKCIFDTGVHYVGSLDEGENLHQIFKYLGIINDLNIHKLDTEGFDVFRFPGDKTFKFGQGYEKFKEILINDFPTELTAIELFCSKIQEVCKSFPLYNLEVDSPQNYINNPDILSDNAWDFIVSITENRMLRTILFANGPLYAGEKDKTPLFVLALITNSYIKGSYRFVNGGSQIAKLLTKKLRAFGGEIIKHQKVVGANFENELVTSVITKEGKEYFGKNFISNLHPKTTIQLFGEDKFRVVYKNRINKLENTISSFMLYISFHENSFPYFNCNFYDYFTDELDEIVSYKKEVWPNILFSCTPVPSKNEKFAESIAVMTYMNFEEVSEWSTTFNTIAVKNKRGESYEEFKKRKEQLVIDKLEVRFPGVKKAIKNVYSSTPLTYRDYIGNEDGALYGIKKNSNNILNSTINPKTRIPNLFLTGQNLIFHGVLGATIGALVTCFKFIDNKTLIDKIKDAT
jgi:all-trans-retinol 13,14-reductase